MLRRLNDSLEVDSRLFREDIRGSREWARALHHGGHLTAEHHLDLQEALDKATCYLIYTITIIKKPTLISI